MTGKELILYILQNNLENTVVLEDGLFTGFITAEEVAIRCNVGVETVRAWYNCKWIKGTKIGETLYFRKDVADPRITISQNFDNKLEMGYGQ